MIGCKTGKNRIFIKITAFIMAQVFFITSLGYTGPESNNNLRIPMGKANDRVKAVLDAASSSRRTPVFSEPKATVQVAQAPSLPIISHAQSFNIPYPASGSFGIPKDWQEGMYYSDDKDSIIDNADIRELKNQASYYKEDLEARRVNLEITGMRTSAFTDAHGRKYNFQLYQIKGRLFFVQIFPDKKVQFNDIEIRKVINLALGREDMKDLDRSRPFFILRPQRSAHIYGDCITNHVMYINRYFDDVYARLEAQQSGSGKILLQVGVEHELYHELTGKGMEIEDFLRKKDAERLVELARNNDGVLQLLITQEIAAHQFETDYIICAMGDKDISDKIKKYCIEMLRGLLDFKGQIKISQEQVDALVQIIKSTKDAYIIRQLAFAIQWALISNREIRLTISQLNILFELYSQVSPVDRSHSYYNEDILYTIRFALSNNAQLLQPIIDYYAKKNNPEFIWVIGAALGDNQELVKPVMAYFISASEKIKQELIHAFEVELRAEKQVKFDIEDLDVFMQLMLVATGSYRSKLVGVIDMILEKNKLMLNSGQVGILLQALSIEKDNTVKAWLASALGHALEADAGLKLTAVQFAILLAILKKSADSSGKFAHAIARAIDNNKKLEISPVELEIFLDKNISAATEESKWYFAEVIGVSLGNQRSLWLLPEWMNFLIKAINDCKSDESKQWFGRAIGMAIANHEPSLEIVLKRLTTTDQVTTKWLAYAIGIAIANNQALLEPIFEKLKASKNDKEIEWFISAISVGLETNTEIKLTLDQIDSLFAGMDKAVDNTKEQFAKAICNALKNDKEFKLTPQQVSLIIQLLANKDSSHSYKTQLAIVLKYAADNDKQFAISTKQLDDIIAIIPDILDCPDKPLVSVIGVALANTGVHLPVILKVIESSYADDGVKTWLVSALGIAIAQRQSIGLEIFKKLEQEKETFGSKWLYYAIGIAAAQNQEVFETIVKKLDSSGDSARAMAYSLGIAIANNTALLATVLQRLETSGDSMSYNLAYGIGIAIARREELFETILSKLKASSGRDKNKFFADAIGIAIRNQHEFLNVVIKELKAADDGYKKSLASAINVNQWDKSMKELKYTPVQFGMLIDAVLDPTTSYGTKKEVAEALGEALQNNRNFALSLDQIKSFLKLISSSPSHSTDNMYSLAKIIGIGISHSEGFLQYAFDCFEKGSQNDKRWIAYAINLALKSNKELSLGISQFTVFIADLTSESSDKTRYCISEAIATAMVDNKDFIELIFKKLNIVSKDSDIFWLIRSISDAIKNDTKPISLSQDQIDIIINAIPRAQDTTIGWIVSVINNVLEKSPSLKINPDQLDIFVKAVPKASKDTYRNLSEVLKVILKRDSELKLSKEQIGVIINAISSITSEYYVEYYGESISIALERDHSLILNMAQIDILIKAVHDMGANSHGDRAVKIAELVIAILDKDHTLKLGSSQINTLIEAINKGYSNIYRISVSRLIGMAAASNPALIQIIFNNIKYSSSNNRWFVEAVSRALEKNKNIKLDSSQIDLLIKNIPSEPTSRYSDDYSAASFAQAIGLALRNNHGLKLNIEQIDILIKNISRNAEFITAIRHALENNRAIRLNSPQFDIVTKSAFVSSLGSDHMDDLSYIIGIAIADNPEFIKPIFAVGKSADIKVKKCYIYAFIIAIKNNQKLIEQIIDILKIESNEDAKSFIVQVLHDFITVDKKVKLTSEQVDALIAVTTTSSNTTRVLLSAIFSAFENNKAIQLTLPQIKFLIPRLMIISDSAAASNLCRLIANTVAADKNIKLELSDVSALIKTMPKASNLLKIELCRAVRASLENDRRLKISQDELNVLVKNIPKADSKADEYADSARIEFSQAIAFALKNNKELKLDPARFVELLDVSSNDAVAELAAVINIIFNNSGSSDKPELTFAQLVTLIKALDASTGKAKEQLAWIIVNMELENKRKLRLDAGQVEILVKAIASLPDTANVNGKLAYAISEFLRFDKDIDTKLTPPLMDMILASMQKASGASQTVFFTALFNLLNSNTITSKHLEILIDIFSKLTDGKTIFNCSEVICFILKKDNSLIVRPNQVDVLINGIPVAFKGNYRYERYLAESISIILKNNKELKLTIEQFNILTANACYAKGDLDKEAFVRAIIDSIMNDIELVKPLFSNFRNIEGKDNSWFENVIAGILSNHEELLAYVIQCFDTGSGDANGYFISAIGNSLAKNPMLLKPLFESINTAKGDRKLAIIKAINHGMPRNASLQLTSDQIDALINAISVEEDGSIIEALGSILSSSIVESNKKLNQAQIDIIIKVIAKASLYHTKEIFSAALRYAAENDKTLTLSKAQFAILIQAVDDASNAANPTNNCEKQLSYVIGIALSNDAELLKIVIDSFETVTNDKARIWFGKAVELAMAGNEKFADHVYKYFIPGWRYYVGKDHKARQYFIQAIGNALAENQGLASGIVLTIALTPGTQEPLSEAMGIALATNAKLFKRILFSWERTTNAAEFKLFHQAVSFGLERNKDVLKEILNALKVSPDKTETWFAEVIKEVILKNRDFIRTIIAEIPISGHDKTRQFLSSVIRNALAEDTELLNIIIDSFNTLLLENDNKWLLLAIEEALSSGHKELIDPLISFYFSRSSSEYVKRSILAVMSRALAVNHDLVSPILERINSPGTLLEARKVLSSIISSANSPDLLKHVIEFFQVASNQDVKATLILIISKLLENKDAVIGQHQLEILLKEMASSPDLDSKKSLATAIGIAISHEKIGAGIAGLGLLPFVIDNFKSASDENKKWLVYAIKIAMDANNKLRISTPDVTIFIDAISKISQDSSDDEIFLWISNIIIAVLVNNPELKLVAGQIEVIIQVVSKTTSYKRNRELALILHGATVNDKGMKLSPSQITILVDANKIISRSAHNLLAYVIGMGLSNDETLLAFVLAGFKTESFSEKEGLAKAIGIAVANNHNLVGPVIMSFMRDMPDDGSEWFGRALGEAQSTNPKSLESVLGSFETAPDGKSKEYFVHSLGIALANNEGFTYPLMDYFKAVYQKLNPKSQPQEVRIKDAHKCEHINLKNTPTKIAALPDGNLAVAIKKEKSIFIINPITGDMVREISNIGLIGEVSHIAVIQNGYLAICDAGDLNRKNGEVIIVDPVTGNVVKRITTIKEPVCVCMLNDTLVIGTNDHDNPLIIIDPNTGNIISQFKKGQFKDSIGQPMDLVVYNDNLIIADFFYDNVTIIDPVTGAIVKQFPGEVNKPNGMSIFNNYLIVATEFNHLVVFDLKTREIIKNFTDKELGPSINTPNSIVCLGGKFYIANDSAASMSELELDGIAPIEHIPATAVVKDYTRVKPAREIALPDFGKAQKLILMPDGNLVAINKTGAPPIVFLNPETGALIEPKGFKISLMPTPPIDIVVLNNQLAFIYEDAIIIYNANTWDIDDMFASHDLGGPLKKPSCAVTIDNKLVIVSNGANPIVIVDLKTRNVERITKSQLGHSLNASQKATVINGKLAILNGGEESVVIIDPKDWSVIRKLTNSDLEGKLNHPKGIATIDGMLAIINYFDDSIVLIDPANDWKVLKKYTNIELGEAVSGPKDLIAVNGALCVLNGKKDSMAMVAFQDKELQENKRDAITLAAYIVDIAVSSNKDRIKSIIDYMENNSQEEFVQTELATVISDILAKDEGVLNSLIGRLKAAKAESKQLFIDIIKDSLSKNHKLIQPILKSFEEFSPNDKKKLAVAISDVVSSDIELFNFTFEYLSHIPRPATDDTIEEALAAIISIALERNAEIKLTTGQLKALFDLLALLGSWFNNPAKTVPRSIALYLATAISSALKNNKALKPSSNDFGPLLEKLQNSVYIAGSSELQVAFSFAAGMCAASNPDILSRLLEYLGRIKVTDNATMNLRNLVISSLTTAINYNNDTIKPFLVYYDTASDDLESAMEIVITRVLTAAPGFLNALIDYIKTASKDKKTLIMSAIGKAMSSNPDIANSFSSLHLEALIPLICDAAHKVNNNALSIISLALESNARLKLTFDQLKVALEAAPFGDPNERDMISKVLVHSFANAEDIIEPMFKYIETVKVYSGDIQLFFFKTFIVGAGFAFTEDIVDTVFRIYFNDDTDDSVKLQILEFLNNALLKDSKFNLKASQFNMLIDSIPHYSSLATGFVCSIISEILKNNKALQLNPAQMKILVDELIGKDANLPASRGVIKGLAMVISNELQNNPGSILNNEEIAKIMDMMENPNLPDDIKDQLGLVVGRAMVNNKKLYTGFFEYLVQSILPQELKYFMVAAGVAIRNDRVFLERLIGYFKEVDWEKKRYIADRIYVELETARQKRRKNMKIKLSQPEFDIFMEAMPNSTNNDVFLSISKVVSAAMADNPELRLSISQKGMIINMINKATQDDIKIELARMISRVMPETTTIAMAKKNLITGSNMEQIDGILDSLTNNRYYNEVVENKENYLKTVFDYLEQFIVSGNLDYDNIPYLNDSLRILINKARPDLIPKFLAPLSCFSPGLKKEKIMEFALEVVGLPASEKNMLLSLIHQDRLSTKLQSIEIEVLFKEVTAANYKEEPYSAYLYLKLRKEMKEMAAGLSYSEFSDVINDKKADSLFNDMIARFILKEVSYKTIDLSDKDQDTIIYLSIDINDALLKLVTENNGFDPKDTFTFRELKEFNIDFSSYYLQKGSLEGVLEYFIITASVTYGFFLKNEANRKKFVDLLESKIRENQEFLRNAYIDSPNLRLSAGLKEFIEHLVRYGTYSDIAPKLEADEITEVRATQAAIERASQVQKPLILFTSDDSYDVVDRAFEKLINPDSNRHLFRLPMSGFTARRNFFGMYLPLSVPSDSDMKYLFEHSTEEDIKQALDKVLRLEHDASLIAHYYGVWQVTLKNDPAVLAAVSCYLRYQDDWEKEMKWYDGILKIIRDEARNKKDQEYFLLFENVEAMPDKVRVQFNPVLLENVVEVPELGMSISLPKNVHIVFTMHKDSEIKDPSFMDRPVRHYVSDLNQEDMTRYLINYASISQNTAETLIAMYQSVKQEKWDEAPQVLFFDIAQIARSIHGISQDPKIKEAGIIKQEFYSYLFLKLRNKRDKTRLTKLIYGKTKLPEAPSLEIKDSKLYCGGAGLKLSNEFLEFIAARPGINAKDAISEYTGFDVQDTERWVFSQLARTLLYRHTAVQLEGPSGEGKTEIGKTLTKLLDYNLNHFTINEDTNLSQFAGQLTPDKYGRYYISHPRYLDSARTQGNVHMFDEINTCKSLYYWLYPEITASSMKYIVEFPLQDVEEETLFRRLPIDQNNLWLFTINPDSFQGREPTPRPISNHLIRFYMEIPQEEIPNIVTDLILKSNGKSAQQLDDKALRKITKELGTMHTNFRRLVREGIFLSGQDITKRALIRTVEGLFQYMNQGIAVDKAFSLALEDNYVYIWHNLEDINTAIETVKKYFKGFHSSSPEQALKRKLSATKKPIFIFTNGSNKQEDVEKMIAKELRTAKTLSVALNWFTNRRQLIGGLSTKKLATEEVVPDSRIAALKDKMKIEFEMGLGIVPQLINTARANPSQEYIAYLYNYMHLNPKVAPLLNEFFQTGKLETNGVITAEIASNLFGQFETSVIPFADNIFEYNSTHAEKLPENASQFNDSQKLIMAQWFYSTLPSNLRFIAFDSSHEKQNLSPAEIDRFSPVNIAAPINEKWIEEYVNTWIGANLKALPEDIRAYVLNYVLTVYWLYKGAEENGVYKHIRLSRQDIDVFLEEFKEALARNPESDQKDLARRIGYYSLSVGFMPEYFKGQALPSDMPDYLKENFSELLVEPLITNPEVAMQYKQASDCIYVVIDKLIWFKTNFKDMKEADDAKEKFLAPAESAVRRYGAMLIGIKHNRTIILEGYQGGGKTSSLEDLALRIGQPSYSSIMYEDIDIGEILGKLTMRGRKIVLTTEEKDNKGKFLIDFLNAYSFGGIYNADEGAMGKNSQELLALLQLMSELSEIDLGQFHPGLDMVIKKHPDFRLAITQNPANSTLGRSHIPYAVDIAAAKIWVDNRLSEADCIRVINYYLTDSKGISEQVKRFISRIHIRFLEEHPDRDSLSPRQLIAFSQLLNQEFLKPETSRDIASCIFQGVMNNYLATIVSERQFYDLWASMEDVFEGDPLVEELNKRLKAWQSKIVVTRTNGTIDFGGITLPVGKARAENIPKEDELTYPLSIDVGSANRALRDFALALSLGRPVALLEEDGTDVLDKIKRFCVLADWELYTLNCHYEMTRMHILDSLLPTFGEMDDYGIKTENISEGFKMALGFLSQHLIREDEYQAIKESGDYSHKVLFFSYMDAIPERQRVMLHRLLTERRIAMTDQKGERHEYVLPEWVHLAVSAPLEHKFSSPFINRFSRVAVRSTKKVSEIRAIVKSKYPNVTSNEVYWLTALAAKMYQLDKGRSFNIHYGFSINDVLYLAELVQREKQRDVDHFKTDPFYYALKAATIFYLSALEETARNKWEKDIFVSYWMEEIVFKKDKLLLDAMAKAYQKLQAQIDAELTKIEVEKVEHPRIRIDGEEINQGVLLKNGINVIKIGEVIIVQTPGNIYRIEEKELRNAKPKELSPTLHIQLLDGKNLVVICTIISSIGGYAIPRDEQTKEYALPPHEVKSRDYIEYTSSIKRQLSAMLRATAKVEEPGGRIRLPRVMIWNGESGTGKTTLERNLTAIWGISMYQLNAYEDIRVSDITAELRLEEGKFKVGVKEFLARCGKINGKRIRLSQKEDTTLKILLLDEANANPDILFALMPLFRGEKKFSVYFAGEVFEVELDSDVLLVLTFNPSERYSGRYALADELGFNAVKLWMPDPLKYTRQELFNILKEIHRRGIDKVKKELSGQVHPVSQPIFSDIREIAVPTEKIEDLSGRIVQQEQDIEIEQEIAETPEPVKPKPPARVTVKQNIKITYDKEAINAAIDGFSAVRPNARAQYFIENILEPFLYAALHHDTEDIKVESIMKIARDLGFESAIEKLIIVYSQKIIKMSLLKPALLELRRAIVKNNYYYNIKVLVINKKPYIVFSLEGKILDRISVPPDDLDKLLRKGSSEKRNYKEWRANSNIAQALVIDADDASIKGYFEGEFALALKQPSLSDVLDSSVPDKEKIAWVCYHELGHMFQNITKRKSLNKNIELYSSLFPIIFSEYGLKYIKNELVNRIKIVVEKGGVEKARNDYYCQAAKAILNGFAIYLNENGKYAELIPNFDETFYEGYVDYILQEIEKLSPQEIKDMAVKFFKNPQKYLSTVEPGKYKVKIMRGKGGKVSIIEIRGDLEEKPEMEIEYEEDMGEDTEIEVTEDDKEPEEGILELDEESGATDDIEDDYYSEEEAGLSGTMKKLTGMSGDLVRRFLSVFALPDQIVQLPSESGEVIDILLKIMGSLEPFIQRKRVKKEGMLSFGITIDVSGSVHGNALLKNAFTQMTDYYTSLFYLAASINKDMEFSLSAIGNYFHMLLPASECRNKEKVELALSKLWGVQDFGGINTVEVIKGIRHKYAKTKDRPNKVEFVFTDGGEGSGVGFAELRKLLNKLEEELGIDIVFVGIGSHARDVKQYNRYLYFENVPDPKDMIDAIMKLSIDKVKRGRLQSGNLADTIGLGSQSAKAQAIKLNEAAVTGESIQTLRSAL